MSDHPLEAWFYRGHLACYFACTAAISGVEQAAFFYIHSATNEVCGVQVVSASSFCQMLPPHSRDS